MPAPWDRPAFRYLALLAVAALLILVVWQGAEQGAGPQKQAGPKEPDSFANNAVYMAFDSQGKLSSELRSPRVEQFNDRNQAHMSDPRARLFSTDTRTPWLLRANQGTYNLKTDTLTLNGDVLVTRPMPNQTPAELHTPHLTLDNSNGIVHTDAPVTIDDASGVTHAVGMKAWIDKRVLELRSQVTGSYELQAEKGTQ